ncbi:D-amino-acid transaminase [Paroceanicella profunda]|uniref:Probable branched-chain-amino-acid aminotransferase n=1 Tax=Paroceanicella profunda TaxID=2579971 RepID=A0A5B8FZB0_9RHOB|nr:D-amino-acid transaminase [Paroceanicella profunda]QDL93024.1 D-amino-acid transaminase [Paroceanicella profunda]
MSRIVYVNGEYVPEEEAKISVFDRGFLFADAVYEVTTVLDGKLCEFEGHCARLQRSTAELEMPLPWSREELLEIHRELIARNELIEGMIYLQVSRGAPADRDFHYPEAGTQPSLVMFTQAKSLVDNPSAARGNKVISVEDIRWARRDIKTVQLLAASMAKMQAEAAGADDAWFVQDGLVNEGSSNNAWIVTKQGTLVTRDLSRLLLPGITRASVLKYAEAAQLKFEERPFTIAEAQDAAEAFSTSASAFVMPVVEVDGVSLGDGTPGPVTKRLRELYIDESRKALL